MKLIVGLGNPGLFYARNRHNIGFMCVNYLAKEHGIRFDAKEGKARVGRGKISGQDVLLARPQTGMNVSGDAVVRLVRKHRIDLADLIVIHDDLDLPLGKIRISYGSSSGGHKGVNSIISHLEGQQEFVRVRVGIGRPEVTTENSAAKEDKIIDHVLSDFSREEKNIVSRVIPEVRQAVLCLLTESVTAAMNRFH